jgi:hypothetical protein
MDNNTNKRTQKKNGTARKIKVSHDVQEEREREKKKCYSINITGHQHLIKRKSVD